MMTGSGGGGNNGWTEEQKWEMKKAKQAAMMARGKGPSASSLGGGALGLQGIGQAATLSASRGVENKPTYPSPSDLPKYGSIADAQAGQKQAFANLTEPGFGQGYSVKPNVSKSPTPEMQGQGVATKPAATPSGSIDDAAKSVYSDDNSAISAQQGAKSYGLSTIPSPDKPNATQVMADAIRFNTQGAVKSNPQAPRRTMQEEQERQALLRQATTVQKGAKGITAAQMNIAAGLQSGNDKLKNDNYQAQLGAANNIEQAQIREGGANARAALNEVGAMGRQDQQLGFDADKFQQSLALDSQRLSMQQVNDAITNYAPKKLNDLYSQYETVETDAEKSAVAAQIRALKGVDEKEREDWVAITGGQTIKEGLPVDNAPMLLNKRTGQTKAIDGSGGGTASLDPSNPEIAAILADGSTNYAEKQKLIDELTKNNPNL